MSASEAGAREPPPRPGADVTTDPSAAQRVLISYPKSGRTWFRYIFNLAGMDVEFTHAGGEGFGKEAQPRFDEVSARRGVFLHRNPIDASVSLFFHLNNFKFRPFTWRHAKALIAGTLPPRDLRTFLSHPGFGVERACKYNRAWLDRLASSGKGVLIVRYEDMIAEPEATLSSVMRHYGREQTIDIAALIERASFEKMRAAEAAGGTDARDLKLGHKNRRDPDARKVRRGKVGGYRDYLSEAEQREFEAICSRYDLT